MKTLSTLTVGALATLTNIAIAGTGASADAYQTFQRQNLYEPASYVLNREARGGVTIYDGFTSAEVDQVMDEQYERIGNMMFTRMVYVSDEGDEVVFDDGCD